MLVAERSAYQRDCDEYYRLLRQVHSQTFTGEDRRAKELTETRYYEASHPAVKNLGSLIDALHERCGDGRDVVGVDYGCGSHWFVDYVRNTYGWSATGYDADQVAIETARRQFPASADFYQQRNPLAEGLPEKTDSQTFVFCNAVIQHFDDAECDRALAEIARVLRPGGMLLLIFKLLTPRMAAGLDDLSGALKLVDPASGTALYQDPTMKAAIAKLSEGEKSRLDAQTRDGWRLMHLYSAPQIADLGSRHGLSITGEESAPSSSPTGIITYRSGKGMPTAAAFLGETDPRSRRDQSRVR